MNPSADELRRASNHLFYEAWMLRQTGERLSRGVEDEVVLNALIESFLLHARALLDFLYVPGQDDDVVASHFNSDWPSKRPPMTEDLEKLRKRVNKEVAHLTYARQIVRDKSWPYGRMAEGILNVLDDFHKRVPTNLVGERWKQKKDLPMSTLSDVFLTSNCSTNVG